MGMSVWWFFVKNKTISTDSKLCVKIFQKQDYIQNAQNNLKKQKTI